MNNLSNPLSPESRFVSAVTNYIITDIGTDPDKEIRYTEPVKDADGVLKARSHDQKLSLHVDEKGRHLFKDEFAMSKIIQDYLNSLGVLDLTDAEKMDRIDQLVDEIISDERVEASMEQLNANIYEQEKAKGNVDHPSKDRDYVKERFRTGLKFSILAPLTKNNRSYALTR